MPLLLKVKAGHGSAYTLIVMTSGHDKAQLLVVSQKQCTDVSSDLTPREACEKIMGSMQQDMEGLVGPARTSKRVADLRVIANGCRNAVLEG